jgi:hypothetical protein
MARAHSRGVVHRDLKPQNVLVTPENRDALPEVRIVDFGIAKAPVELFSVAAATSVTKYWTELGTVMGSPPYMAPEQRGAAQMATGQADVFALGVMLLGATLAIDLESLEQRSQALSLPEDLETALELRGPLPQGWETLLRAMLQDSPGSRPTMSEVVLQLQRLSRTDAEFAQAVEAWVRQRRVPRAQRLLKLAQAAEAIPYLTDDEREFLQQAPLQRVRALHRSLGTTLAMGGGLAVCTAAAGYWLTSKMGANEEQAGALRSADERSLSQSAAMDQKGAAVQGQALASLAQAERQSAQLSQRLAAAQKEQKLQAQQLAARQRESEQLHSKLSACEVRQRDTQRDVVTLNEKLTDQEQLLARCDQESERLLVCRQETAVKSRELAETTQRLHTCTKSLRGLGAPPVEKLQLGMSTPESE